MSSESDFDRSVLTTVVGPPRWRLVELSSRRQRIRVFLWRLVAATLFRWSPVGLPGLRVWLLRCFGAKIGRSVTIAPTTRIKYPWNLEIGHGSQILDAVILDCLAPLSIGVATRVSQFSHLCTATRRYDQRTMPIVGEPIVIGHRCWLAADVFVGSGVSVGDGAVVGARCSVFGDVPPGVIVVGNPARVVRSPRDSAPRG